VKVIVKESLEEAFRKINPEVSSMETVSQTQYFSYFPPSQRAAGGDSDSLIIYTLLKSPSIPL